MSYVEGKENIYRRVPLSPSTLFYFKSYFYLGVKSDLPMEICFFYLLVCSLPFPH